VKILCGVIVGKRSTGGRGEVVIAEARVFGKALTAGVTVFGPAGTQAARIKTVINAPVIGMDKIPVIPASLNWYPAWGSCQAVRHLSIHTRVSID
ncbi:MAG: hypothetical protein Q7U74_01755, partial [Saprospiraceae bacterium]|nr:hypothetical protein [Saprospiraceae bacterium]